MTAHRMRAARSVATLAVAVGVILSATPAGAHGTSGPPASNVQTTVRGIRPPNSGVTAHLGPDRDQIELRVTGRATVTVLGYRNEPYLRVDPRGAFENRSSPAVALNPSRDISPTAKITRRIAPPRWVRISGSPEVRWHDHRAHWMSDAEPAATRANRHHPHVIERWTIPIRVDGHSAAIRGTITWQPPPSVWPWVAGAGILAALTIAGTRIPARRTVFAGAIAIIAGGEALHLWGGWMFSTTSTIGRIGENLPSLAAIVVAIVAFVWLVRRGVWSAAPLMILAGLFGFVSGGLADLPTIAHSVPPTRFDPTFARLLVSLALGVGLGTAVGAAARLRAPRPMPVDLPG